MTKELRRLSILMLLMFVALFASTSWIQVVDSENLSQHQENRRALYDSYLVQRGSIIASGTPIAYSTPSADVYSWHRVYEDATMWAPVTGWINSALGSSSGLERAMNQELSGSGGSQFFNRLESVISGQQPRGSSVAITIDTDVQRAAFDALGEYQGAVIAIEPATGRILAMVSTPSFDTNLLASHNADAVNADYAALEADPLNPLYNRAIAGGLNPPGSTFKLVVVSAALASGKYTPDSALPNPGVFQLPQSTQTVRNASGGACGAEETVTIAEALRLSCNIPFAELALELGDDAIREEAEKYGFNLAFDTPLASTASSYPRALDDPQTALTGFGQGRVIATPLQMAMVSAGIANGGVVMNPQLIDQVIAPDLSVLSTFTATEFQRALDAKVSTQMVEMMVTNVSTGVAGGARIDGVDVAGKTGTAENGTGNPYTLWFTGFAPADNPKVAVAVVVEDGGGQGQTGSGDAIAAPIAKEVMEAVLNK